MNLSTPILSSQLDNPTCDNYADKFSPMPVGEKSDICVMTLSILNMSGKMNNGYAQLRVLRGLTDPYTFFKMVILLLGIFSSLFFSFD